MVLDYFESPIAYNPDTDDLVSDASFQVFAPDDASFATPLPVTDPASGANISVLSSSSIGVLPAFRVAGDLPQVVIKSGAFTTLLSSRFGALIEAGFDPEAIAAAVASVPAAEAARDAAIEAKEAAEAVGTTNDAIMTAVGADPESAFRAQQLATIAAAIAAALDGFQSAPSYLDAPYSPGSTVFPINADVERISIWGSSSAESIAPYLASVLDDLGVTVYNGGDAGAQSFHVFAALGSLPAKLTFPSDEIPASGSVTVTADADFTVGVSNLKAFTGSIAGVPGTLSYTGGALTFARTSAGSAVAVAPGSPFIPTNGTARRADVTLLWAGKNDLSSGIGIRPLEGIIQRTDRAFDWLAPLYKRALVLGHFADSDASSTMVNDRIGVVNAAHAARYGPAFLDVQAYLMSSAVWDDTGITPTSGDLAQQAAGQKPASLSSDAAHLNAAGLAAVAALIRARLITLGWYEDVPPPPPITSDGFSGGDVASIHNRTTDLYAGGDAKTWIGSKDGSGQDMKIAAGQLSRAGMTSASGVWLLSIPMDVPDYEIEFDLVALPTGFGLIVDLRRPSTTSGANGYRNTINVGTPSVAVQKRVSNTYSTIVSGAGTVAPGQRLKFRVKGSTVSFFVDGELRVSGVDEAASFTAGGYVGFGSSGACLDAVIDNVVIRPV